VTAELRAVRGRRAHALKGGARLGGSVGFNKFLSSGNFDGKITGSLLVEKKRETKKKIMLQVTRDCAYISM